MQTLNERLTTRYYMRTNPAGFDSDDDGNLIDPLEEAAQIGGTESRDIVEDIGVEYAVFGGIQG